MSAFPLPRRITYALAFVSGLLYWLGFPGMEVWPCAFIAFVPLWIALQGQTPRVALLAGLITVVAARPVAPPSTRADGSTCRPIELTATKNGQTTTETTTFCKASGSSDLKPVSV